MDLVAVILAVIVQQRHCLLRCHMGFAAGLACLPCLQRKRLDHIASTLQLPLPAEALGTV